MSGARAMPNGEEAPPTKTPVQPDMSPGISANKNLSKSAPVPSDMPFGMSANNIVGMSVNKNMPQDRNRHGNRFAAIRQTVSPRKETLLTLLAKRRGEGEVSASLCTIRTEGRGPVNAKGSGTRYARRAGTSYAKSVLNSSQHPCLPFS
jgi:hypothetical protein